MHKIPFKSTRFDLHLFASIFWHLAALVYLTAVTTLLFEPLGFHRGKPAHNEQWMSPYKICLYKIENINPGTR